MISAGPRRMDRGVATCTPGRTDPISGKKKKASERTGPRSQRVPGRHGRHPHYHGAGIDVGRHRGHRPSRRRRRGDESRQQLLGFGRLPFSSSSRPALETAHGGGPTVCRRSRPEEHDDHRQRAPGRELWPGCSAFSASPIVEKTSRTEGLSAYCPDSRARRDQAQDLSP